MQRPTNSPARDPRSLSFSDVGEDNLPNPLISDFRAPGVNPKSSAKDIWSRETLSPSGRGAMADSAPALRASKDGIRAATELPLSGSQNRPKANTPPTPPSATAARPLYESTPHGHNPFLAGRNPRDIPLAPRKSASLGPAAGTAVMRPAGSDLKKQTDFTSASVEVLRLFTEIEALENRLRRSSEKDSDNLKLITTIETEVGGKDDHTLYMMPNLNSDGSPQGSPRSPRSPVRASPHPQQQHINVYSKSIPSPPFSPGPIEL